MLRDVDAFDGQFSFGANGQQERTSVVKVDDGPDGLTATISDAHLLFTADFARLGTDLVLRGQDGQTAIVQDYFTSDARATLMSREGARLSQEIVAVLTGQMAPGQYAQAGQTAAPAATDAVGRVVTVTGDAMILRNGVAVTLQPGDPILRADVLQTGSGSLAVTFNDGSTINLTANSRIVVSEFVYDPNGAANSQLLDLVQGSLTFISGEIAHNGNMRIGTPVATMGIRGTVGGVTTADDGTVQFYVSQSATGAVIIDGAGRIVAQVVQDGPMIVVRPAGPLQVLAEELQKSPAQLAIELAALQQIVSIKAVGDQIIQQFFQPPQDPNDPNPNPQTPDQPRTQIQIDLQRTVTVGGNEGPASGNVTPPDQVVVRLIPDPVDDKAPPPPVVFQIPPNLPPLSFSPLQAAVNEDELLTFSGSRAITVFDADTTVLTVTLTATNGVLNLNGVAELSFASGDGVNDTAMSFSGTQAAINAALSGATFRPAQDYNGPAAVTVTVTDGISPALSGTIAIAVAPVNDAPVIGQVAGAALAYTENQAATAVHAGLILSDVDNSTFTGATVTISGNFKPGEDVLSFTSPSGSGITGTYANGVLTLSGTASVADYQAALRSVSYSNSSDNPSADTRTISFQVNDGSAANQFSNIVTATVNVTPVNDAPQFYEEGYSFTALEHAAFGTIVGTVQADDADNDALTYSILSGNDDGAFSIDGDGNIIVAGLLDYDFNGRDLVVAATDPDGLSDVVAVHIEIEDVAEPAMQLLTSSAGVQISATSEGATRGFLFPGAGNVTTPGTPEDRIVLGYDLGNSSFVRNAAPMLGVMGFTTIATESYAADGASHFASILSADNGVTLTQTISLGWNANFFTTTIDIFNGNAADITNVRFMRNIDPDQDAAIPSNATHYTINNVVQNPGAGSAVAAVEAIGPTTGTVVMLVGDGADWRASAFGFSNGNPYVPEAFANPQDPNGATGDIAITLTNHIGTIEAGGSAHISFLTTANTATAGANALVGTAGPDTIDGLGGSDLLFGLAGADNFVFRAGYGAMTVTDFSGQAGQGDQIEIYDFEFATFAQFQEAVIITDIGTDGDHITLIDLGEGDMITLLGVDPVTLHPSDFVLTA